MCGSQAVNLYLELNVDSRACRTRIPPVGTDNYLDVPNSLPHPQANGRARCTFPISRFAASNCLLATTDRNKIGSPGSAPPQLGIVHR